LFPSASIIGRSFDPQPLDASGVLIRVKLPDEEKLPAADHTNGWGNLFQRGLEVVPAVGTHTSLINHESNAVALARQIIEVCDRYKSMLDRDGLADEKRDRLLHGQQFGAATLRPDVLLSKSDREEINAI
jgi:hypothetical protein